MARILISEPHDEVRRMLERMLTRLGHEPLAVTMPTPEQLMSADVLVVEPAAPVGAVLALAARVANPSLPLICVSVAAADPELEQLGVAFAVSLLKPFTARRLGCAIDVALRERRRRPLGGTCAA